LVLQGIYGQDRVLLNYNENLEVRPESIPPGTRCIHGHFPSTHYDRVLPHFDLVTWLRHPVDRVVSNYHYFLRHPDAANPCSEALMKGGLSIEEFARLDLMRNVATRYMAGKAVREFKFIGVAEMFQESLDAFGAIFGVPVPAEPPWVNTDPDRASATNRITDEAFQRILELNQLDLGTYELAAAKIRGATVEPWTGAA
jgi:hypothetical protein